ncbi:MAG: hypothetical protein J6A70_05190 [Prevotella sp.]|nr:hypothetical protein [Prevotella sp.]
MRILLFLCFLTSLLSVSAQIIDKRYVMHIGTEGTVYHFLPVKVSSYSINKKMHCTYDMTYNTSEDSIVLNFTVFVETENGIDSLALCSGKNAVVNSCLDLLYVERAKNSYRYRYTSRFSYADIMSLFAEKFPLVFTFYGDETFECRYTDKKWKKECRMINEVFNLIRIQKTIQ